jgi:imidazole glycerol-phosphate synthase subunit HisH
MIAIINYNVGNLQSIQNMFKKIGVESCITNEVEKIERASKILLPGVGSFDYCMQEFNKSLLQPVIEQRVFKDGIPIMGICVGHQMLFSKSAEGNEKGLGWLQGEVVKFEKDLLPANYKIPNMGWCELTVNRQNALFRNIENPRFYFCHSYHASTPNDMVVATASYGYEFTASVQNNNIFGCQFHPEKSLKNGMAVLKNFASI